MLRLAVATSLVAGASALAPQPAQPQPQRTFVLDFEGALVDAVGETTSVAFEAASQQWPQEMAEVRSVGLFQAAVRKSWVGGDWGRYKDTEDDDEPYSAAYPKWFAAKMRQLKDVTCRGGADAVLAARLCASEGVADRLLPSEMSANWDVLRESLLFRTGAEATDLDTLFQKLRDARQNEPPALHAAVADAVRGSGAEKGRSADARPLDAMPQPQFVVLSRRSETATRSALQQSGLGHVRVVVCERDDDALQALVDLCVARPSDAFTLVGDDISFARLALDDRRLLPNLSVCLAEWGRATLPPEKAMQLPRLDVVDLQRFCDGLRR
ncbi:hypothetical protein M885DRAFT_620920 [Pelagophyceae sp. CCMP2097]|nr:hypothetical protein M885DRAFT_620920 [Pelagophyceae sp. CCMP2097]